MAKRQRATRALKLELPAVKPRNTTLLAAAQGQVKLATRKHEKSAGAVRRAEKMALSQLLPK